MSIIRTYSGRSVSLATPSAADIDIRDIACSLSRINRFSGATRLPINVADHSLNVARLLSMRKAPPATQMLGLLHDAHEAYLGDITAPVRCELSAHAGFDVVSRISEKLDIAILEAFDITEHATFVNVTMVKHADAALLAAEWRDFMQGPCPTVEEPAPFAIRPRNPDRSEEEFLRTFDRLLIEMGPRARNGDVASIATPQSALR